MKHLFSAVDANRKLILDTEDFIWAHPETGYREWTADAYLKKAYTDLGYNLVEAGNIPGFYTIIDTGRPGPRLLILGETDSLVCRNHPNANPETGAVHACGHSAQSAALLGIAAALKQPGALDGLCGQIQLCAVPAEELIELEYRKQLYEKGIIKYFGGKTEFLYRGYFDGVDLAFMVHTSHELSVGHNHVGCLAKKIVYKGKSAHAGGSPWDGCNALYAASQGLSAANAVRETFKESDYIRFHPIMTEGGVAVNAIPERATIESYVRGYTFEGIQEANRRINRALCGAALSLGANIEIEDIPGYCPNIDDDNLRDVSKEASEIVFPNDKIIYENVIGTGSTDMGDLSCIMPTVHSYVKGARGAGHGADYEIFDAESACVGSAKWQLAMAYILLSDGAKRAKKVISEFKPRFESKEKLFEMLESMRSSGDRITYTDTKAEVIL